MRVIAALILAALLSSCAAPPETTETAEDRYTVTVSSTGPASFVVHIKVTGDLRDLTLLISGQDVTLIDSQLNCTLQAQDQYACELSSVTPGSYLTTVNLTGPILTFVTAELP